MARKLSVSNYCGQCAKIASSVFCEDRDALADDILKAIKACTVDDSHDIGHGHVFHLGDTKADEADQTGACDKFELDMSSSTFGMCKCGKPRADHKDKNSAGSFKKMSITPKAAQAIKAEELKAPEPVPVPEETIPEEPEEPVKEEEPEEKPGLEENATAWQKMCSEGEIMSGKEVLSIVRQEHGAPYNWVLFKPRKDALEVVNAGSGSVREMTSVLEREASDKILYGLCRVALGLGRLRRAFWFYLKWTGENCKGVKSIQMKRETEVPMEEMVGEKSFTITATHLKDVTPDTVITKIMTTCTVDSGKDGKYTVEDLIAALEEEQKEIQRYYAEKERKKYEAEETAKRVEEEKLKQAEEEERARKEAERMAQEQAEKDRLEAAKEAAPAAAVVAASSAPASSSQEIPANAHEVGFISSRIKKISDSSEPGWILFTITV